MNLNFFLFLSKTIRLIFLSEMKYIQDEVLLSLVSTHLKPKNHQCNMQ